MDCSFIEQNCRANGIAVSEIYRTLLIKERGNLTKPEANQALLTVEYQKILREEIDAISPNVVVPLSELSFNFISGLKGIRKYRGSVIPTPAGSRLIRCIPVLGLNPYINQDPKLLYLSRLDFEKVGRNQGRTDPIPDDAVLWVAKTGQQLKDFINRSYEKSIFMVFDIETFCGIPTCISFCFDGYESVTASLTDNELSAEDKMIFLDVTAKLLASPIPKVNANIKYDWRKLERWGIIVNNVVGDSQIAASCLMPEFPKSLGFLTSIYTDMPYHKDEGKEYDPRHHDRSRLYFYCAKDSLAEHRIYTIQKEELGQTGTLAVYNMLMDIYPIYHRMENTGILIDDTVRRDKEYKYWTLYDMELLRLSKLTGRSIHSLVGGKGSLSDDKIRKLVYEDLGYTKIRGVKVTEGGKLGVDEETLEILIWRHHHRSADGSQALESIISIRKLKKVLEYLATDIHPDGRMRSEFNLAGAKTGRTTASETTDCKLVLDGKSIKVINLGRSFQTIAKHGFEIDGETYGKDLREMFVPSPGYIFVEHDLSQAEARVDAVLAKDYDILSVFDSRIGIHRLTGSWVFECLPEEIKKNILVDGIDRYHLSKTVRHAAERNMKAERLMMMIHRPIQFCNQVLATFHKKQPNIQGVFHREIRDVLQKTKTLRAPNGRMRQFFGRFDEHMINEGISQLPQAIVTDYLKSGLRQTWDECPWARPLSEAHDGFLAEVPIDREHEFSKHFVKNTQVPIDFRTCTLNRDFLLTIPVEVEVSKENWKLMKSLKEKE